ncbi:hypothetical protein ACHWQZ_G018452 [Mnemiopsis leidyi]
MQMLEGVQRTFTSCIGGLNDMNYWERLVHLQLMSLQRRRESSLRNQTLYDSSFAVRGPKLWNKVPAAIKAEKTFDGFKVSLSKFLALIPDNPPVSDYTCSWSNSLVDFTSTRWSDI